MEVQRFSTSCCIFSVFFTEILDFLLHFLLSLPFRLGELAAGLDYVQIQFAEIARVEIQHWM